MSICLLCKAFLLMGTLPLIPEWMKYQLYLDFFKYSINNIASILLYMALLLFGLKNKIPSFISRKTKKIGIEKTNPEQALKLLKNKFELDMITEEEYQAQRAEIISKL